MPSRLHSQRHLLLLCFGSALLRSKLIDREIAKAPEFKGQSETSPSLSVLVRRYRGERKTSSHLLPTQITALQTESIRLCFFVSERESENQQRHFSPSIFLFFSESESHHRFHRTGNEDPETRMILQDKKVCAGIPNSLRGVFVFSYMDGVAAPNPYMYIVF